MKRTWKGYLFAGPLLLGFLLFYVLPFGQVVWDSLSQGTGKSQLFVGIGCTGGKHRSVTITNALYEKMKDLEYSIKAEHRDVDRDGQHKSSQVR